MQLLKPSEVAAILSVSESTLEAWRAANRGPVWVRVEGRIRYSEERLAEYIKAREGAPAGAGEP